MNAYTFSKCCVCHAEIAVRASQSRNAALARMGWTIIGDRVFCDDPLCKRYAASAVANETARRIGERVEA